MMKLRNSFYTLKWTMQMFKKSSKEDEKKHLTTFGADPSTKVGLHLQLFICETKDYKGSSDQNWNK